ncbi:hypothetical protein K503DRAFT_196614 [Rhizopogon vinicolor AM-OR11-026]|uniref:Phorbol-ester/DAG-type domain-containing protein n=1 Tax=Rhizopogon vinicolor AM-OR11-026 TaxID=1314800 RepID=A0A1B7NIF3_9AGAM|nr:hypothetical protein K503DRAFT_196614 [Rhizopogon vinicolor AM-OR11-026]
MATPVRGSIKPSTPLLRIDTESLTPLSHTRLDHDGSPGATNSTLTPSPSFYIPLSPNVDKYSPSAQLAKMALSQRDSAEHASDESRKLVALLLHQLSTRTRPPPVFDALNVHATATVGAGFGQIMGAVRNVVKQKSHKRGTSVPIPQSIKEDNDDEGHDSVFSSETTFDLMVQLKEVLLFSASQGWKVFEQGASDPGADASRGQFTKSSPFSIRSSMRRSSISGRRSRSPSPSTKEHLKAASLLSSCISILSSVILEDCRFQVSSPRPSKPPNALQSVCLDIAQILTHVHRNEPSIVCRIAFAVLPAFGTFRSEMHSRLLIFFNSVILTGVLEDLNRIRGISTHDEVFASQDQANTVSIQVEMALDDDESSARQTASWQPWTSLAFASPRIQATNAPLHPLPVYYLASITTPLLAAILENIDIASLPPTYSLCRLLDTIVGSKPDSYLDLLEVVAYHVPQSRRSALCLLATFWPRALGHVVISKALPVLDQGVQSWTENMPNPTLEPSASCAHDFVPWRFQQLQRPSTFDEISSSSCHSCASLITGFGLLCCGCMCVVHFDCYDYPEGTALRQYAMPSSGTQRLAVHRFCLIPPSKQRTDLIIVKRAQHDFRLVNLFTLPVCFHCCQPIWGCQALHCTACTLFIHLTCLDQPLAICGIVDITSIHMVVSLDNISQTFSDYYGDVFLSSEDLGKRSFEEISVSSAVLWTQLQIYHNGLALGSFTLASDGHGDKAEAFELQYLVELYEAYLSSGKLPVSSALGEYLQANRYNSSSLAIMFDWSTLAYIASTIKSSYGVQTPSNTSTDLRMSAGNMVTQDENDTARHPFEVVTLGHLRDSLGYEFNMLSEGPARHCLSHLHKLGFFTCADFPTYVLPRPAQSSQLCYFPLPLGFDLSAGVETLVSAIESCLSDLDLSVNEYGFLMMVRRFWPSGLASEYALRRLSHAVLSWIFAEDDSLAKILRDFIPRGINLPGIRSATDTPMWPTPRDARRAQIGSANNGGDYVAARRSLLSRYAARWLLALHDQDVVTYARLLFEIIRDIASGLENCLNGHEPSATAERSLRFIIRLCQASVDFTTLDDLFLMWLQTLEPEVLDRASLQSLQRLLNRDAAENTLRHSTFVDQILAQVDGHVVKLSDPWGMVRRAAKQNRLLDSLRWLRLFARSGVDIDVPVFAEYSELSRRGLVTLKQGSVFAEVALLSTWTRSMGRQDLQKSVSTMFASLEPAIQNALRSSGDNASCALSFIRQSLATCLLLYGCDRAMLVSNGMVLDEDIENLPSRRKQGTRVARATDPVIIDGRLMLVLSTLVATGMEHIVCLIAKFLHSFVMHASLVEAHEVDNFVLRNGDTLYPCIWHFYGVQHHEVASIRTALFLRVLIVDSQSFHGFLSLMNGPTVAWDIRLLALDRLFRMTSDIASPDFVVENRPWKHSVIDLFYYAFEPLWADGKEEVRTAVDTWLQTLLSAHLDAIASCWNDAFPSLSVSERLRLVSFLLQLQSHFPTWRVLSWNTIIETLLEYDYLETNGNDEDGPAAAHLEMYGLNTQSDAQHGNLDPEVHSIQISVALLGLRMMKNGGEIDLTSCLKFKLYMAKIVGFSEARMVSTLNGRAFSIHMDGFIAVPRQSLPCVNEFARILDAPHPFDLPPSLMNSPFSDDDRPCRVLIGSIWIDVVLGAFCAVDELLELPALTLKSLLEALMAMIYKHDFNSPALRHLDVLLRKALKRTLDLLLVDLSYDSRQVALSVIEIYIKRGSAISGALVTESVERAVALIALLKHNAEDMLVTQAKLFIENALVTLAPSGLFCSLCKRPLGTDFISVIKSIVEDQSHRASESSPQDKLREVLLRSVVTQPPDTDWKINHNIALNVKEYTESIYFEGLSTGLIKDLINWLIVTARRASALGNNAGFDPNLLLYISATILQHNKTHAQDLLECTEMVLRVTLSRSNVDKQSLIRALHAVTSLSDTVLGPMQDSLSCNANCVAQILIEVLEDVFRARARVTPSTLNAIVETILCTDIRMYLSPDRAGLRQVACSGLYFLHDHVWMASESNTELSASIAISRLVFHAINIGHTSLSEVIAEGFEKSAQPGTVVRAWNILLLGVLSDSTADTHAQVLISHLNVFASAYYKCLGTYVHGWMTTPSESAVADVEHAFIAIKLWLSLAQIPLVNPTRASLDVKAIWNELWPPLEVLVNLFKTDSVPEDLLPLATTIWSSVAGLFLFVLQSRSPVGLDTIPHAAMLNDLRDSGRRNSALNKLSRALDGEFLPELLPSKVITQTKKDIENAEKLRVLESVQRPMERRRDMRIPT